MKTLASALSTVVCLCLFAGAAYGQADSEFLSNLSILSISKMQVAVADNNYVLKATVSFANRNKEAGKLLNCKFQAFIDTKRGAEAVVLPVGDGAIAELVVPGGSVQEAKKKKEAATIKPGLVDYEVTVALGPKNDVTFAKLVDIWNVVGDPQAPMSMMLKGQSELAKQLPNGWVSEEGKRYNVQLGYKPTVQREVLFR